MNQAQPSMLDDIIGRLGALPPKARAEVEREAMKATAHLKFIPNPGPQTDAFFCPANVLLYGGEGGGGKTGLLLGLGLTQHRRSLILRRKYTDLGALTEEAIRFNGTRRGFNGSAPPKLRTDDARLIEFGAAHKLGDEQSWQGRPHDFLGVDEAVQFLMQQIRFLMGWVRSEDPEQRCRTVLATNPPITDEGQWIVGMFRPWLDITHPNPAEPGELRWYVTDPHGDDLEVDGPTPVVLDGKTYIPLSRTFIPATLRDNPFLVRTGYQAQLDALPEPIRSAVRDGNFMAARGDKAFQVVPLAWVLEAEQRWREDGHRDFAMTAMGFDPSGGGKDSAELCWRHGGWYARLVSAKGKETANGSAAAGTIISHRRDNAPVVVDVGGGYGGQVTLRLKDNGIAYHAFNGAQASTGHPKDTTKLKFANKRAEAWWRFREALDPDQDGGSPVALPPDPELRADLTAPTYDPTARGIVIENKDDIREKIGRSPGKGDAVVMCWSEGFAAVRKQMSPFGTGMPGGRSRTPKVILGHEAARRASGR